MHCTYAVAVSFQQNPSHEHKVAGCEGCDYFVLVAGSDLHSDSNLRLLPAVTCQLTTDSLLKNDSRLVRRMSLHHGPTDLCDNHCTVSFILLWFQASSQASLRF